MRFKLRAPFTFDLYRGLQDLTREPFGLTEKLDGDIYQTVLCGILVSVRQTGRKSLEVELDHESSEVRSSITEQLKRKFDFYQDMNAFHEFARRDTNLVQLIDRLAGLTMFQKSTPFEALVTAITDQQLNTSFATTLKRRLITSYGRCWTAGVADLMSFPEPSQLAKLKNNALRSLQYSGAKSRYIIELARGVVSGKYPLQDWSRLGDGTLLEELISIYGVGRWTAEYAAMVGYGRADIVPAADIGLQKAVQRCYGLEHRPTEAEVRDLSESWRPWRGLVTYYLWHGFE